MSITWTIKAYSYISKFVSAAIKAYSKKTTMGTAPKRKLVVMNLVEEQDNKDILNLFKVFGNVVHFNRPPLRQNVAFVTFEDVRFVSTISST